VKLVCALCACLIAGTAWAEEYSFDAGEFEKQPFEFGGYLEYKPDHSWFNRDGAFYTLNGLDRSTLTRNAATLKLNAKYTQGIASFNLRADAEVQRDQLSSVRINRFDEAYVSLKPGLRVESGRFRRAEKGSQRCRTGARRLYRGRG